MSEFNTRLRELTHTLSEVIDTKIPKTRPSPYQKWWWSKDLAVKHREVCRLTRRAHNRRTEPEDPVHIETKTARHAYGLMIECTKKCHWEEFLESVDEKTVGTAHQYTSGDPMDGGKARVPTLKECLQNGTVVEAESNEDKSRVLCKVFFPRPVQVDLVRETDEYPPPKFSYVPVTNMQIAHAILQLGPYKAPGADGIPNVFLIKCADLLIPHLGPIYCATFSLETYPDQWKDSVTVMLRKPAKPDYTVPSAHRPIALINTLTKVLSACVAEDLVHMVELHKMLPNNHFGCRPGRTTSDSLHFIIKYIKDTWRGRKVVSALFLDVKATFPSVVLDCLIHNMRRRGVPPQYTDWIRHRVEGRKTTLKFDGYKSAPLELTRGIDQGCPLSGIAFQFYNVDLIDTQDSSNGEEAVAFMDDALMLAHGETLDEANSKIQHMMERRGGGLEWSHIHHCDFAMDKFSIMGFSRRREPNPAKKPLTMPACRCLIFLQGAEIPVITIHKFLGVMLDQELHWKDHVNYVLQKGTKWVMQYCRLAKPSRGVSAKYMRRYYISVAVPKMLYTADLFLVPESGSGKGMRGFIGKLGRVQRQAGLHVTGAMRSAPTDIVDAYADLLPFHLLIEKTVHCAATRLATLPSSHPLAKHASKAAARYVKKHRAPIHEMLHAFNIRPEAYETVCPVRLGPKWRPQYPIRVPKSMSKAVEDAMSVQSEVTVYSDGSSLGGGVGAAAMLCRNRWVKAVLRKHLGSAAHHTVFEAEAVGLVLAAELVRAEAAVSMAIIGADSQAAIQATRNVKGASEQYLIDMVHERMAAAARRHRNLKIELRWMPGHEGIPGNKQEDTEAKRAAQGESSPRCRLPTSCRDVIPISRAAAGQGHMKVVKTKAKACFERSPRCQKIWQIDPSTPSARFRKDTQGLPRRQAALLVQLRTGHVPLQKHLHTIGKAESPRCPACHAANETVVHYLLMCLAYARQRKALEGALQRAARSTSTLLANPKAFPHLFKFIYGTRRFCNTLGDPQQD